MRPKAVIWFEALYLLSIGYRIIQLAFAWRTMTANLGVESVVTVLVVTALLPLALVLLVSRRRNAIAKWTLALFTLFFTGLFLFVQLPPLLSDGEIYIMFEQAVFLSVQAAAILLLFTPPAQAWLGAKGKGPDKRLRRTFE